MYTFEWKPEKELAKKFSGHLVLKVPSHMERLDFSRSLLDESSGLSDANILAENSKKIVENAMKHIESVHLIRTEDGFAIPEKEWLLYDKDAAEILGAVGQHLLSGVRLGKK
ncbi:hypothetical protein EKK58_08545 [Candidatus Dependentiae bacterium]|nr:MAG: hypothetical protein EKK58_08545 [Candidatus Dependentiae bacterium]